jgi:hypothetical protein
MDRTGRPDRDALHRLLAQQADVVTRYQALAAGMSDNALRHRLRPGGPWRPLLPGVYLAATGTPTTIQEETAALLYAGQGSVITGLAALRCHHIRADLPDKIDVLVRASRQRRDAEFVRIHRTTRLPERIWTAGPVRYAPPARAVADTVRRLTSLRDVRAVVADAVQRARCPLADLMTELNAGPNRGSLLFREALSDVAVGIASTAEGDLKDLLRRSSLPMPLFNAALYDGTTFVARPDAWWPKFGIAVEVDSREWHMSPEDHAQTLARGRRMARYLVVVLRFTPKQIRSQPGQVSAEIRAALNGAKGRPPLKLCTVPAEAPDQATKPSHAAAGPVTVQPPPPVRQLPRHTASAPRPGSG